MSATEEAVQKFLSASKLMQASEYQEALELFNTIEPELSEVPELYYNKARILTEQEKYRKVIDNINKATSLDPYNIKYLKLKLSALIQVENYEMSIKTAEAILNIQYDIDVMTQLGFLFLRQERFDDAVDTFESLLQDGCNDAAVYFTLGVLKYQSDELVEAEKLMQEAIKQDYHTEEATELLLTILQKSEKTQEALELMENIENRTEGQSFALARLYKQNGDIVQAKSLIDTLIDKYDTIEYINFKAHLLRESNQYEEAVKLYDIVLEHDDSDLSAIKGKALSLMELGEVEEANQLFEEGERINRGGKLPDFDKMVEQLDILE